MAKCDICGKGVTFGIRVSHSHRRSNRAWKPNVQRVTALVDGTPRHIYACTRCRRCEKGQRALEAHWNWRGRRKAASFLYPRRTSCICDSMACYDISGCLAALVFRVRP